MILVNESMVYIFKIIDGFGICDDQEGVTAEEGRTYTSG